MGGDSTGVFQALKTRKNDFVIEFIDMRQAYPSDCYIKQKKGALKAPEV
jgi:hypothetical protein